MSSSSPAAAPRERPILFSAPMVRAILEGRKTMTRRIVTVPWKGSTRALPYEPYFFDTDGVLEMACDSFADSDCGSHACPYTKHVACPYGDPGDRLWVRETFAPRYFDDGRPGYRATWTAAAADVAKEPKWKPSIFMRRAESRISLEVTAARVERLQAITESDAKAEGVATSMPGKVNGKPGTIHTFGPDAYRRAFSLLWEAINGKRAPWASNPWVWVVSFRLVAP